MKTISLFSLTLMLLTIVHTLYGQQASVVPEITSSVDFFESKPIREMTIVLPGEHGAEQRIVKNRFGMEPKEENMQQQSSAKPVLQKKQGNMQLRGPMLNFEGIDNVNNVYPADPNGVVGPDHYVQIVNNSLAVWDKGGNLLYGPVDNQTIWESFPGPWDTYFWSDPIIKYDRLADRWVIASISLDYQDFYTMIAVSTTEDPLGSYYCYAYHFSELNDYPKLSIWPNGFYVTYNILNLANDTFLYSLATVVDRDAMLNGDSLATMIQFQVPNSDIHFFPLPADLSGDTPPTDTPCYIVNLGNHDPDNPTHLSLDVYEFDVDWDMPANATFELVNQFDIGTFEPTIVFGPGAPQLGNSVNVVTIPLYLMYPLTYRSFNGHETMVCCNTIWDGEIHYIKWHELRKENDGWYIYQSGNYAPGDTHYFMPSISINGNGDIAMGYTVSSEEMYPSMRFTGRRAEDSLGVMSFQELELYKGLNYVNTYDPDFEQNRWGDYASMMVDPSDDSTFWFTSMYPTSSTGPGNWATRIFSLNLTEDTLVPAANAGNDTLTCNTIIFETQGEADNYSSLVWTSGGDGIFTTNNSEHSKYLRGADDLDSGQVTLTMHLTGYQAGLETADSMILYLNMEPEVNAGPDLTINDNESVTLQGEVSYAYDYYWETLGDGTLNDSSLLDAIYTPGISDIENGQVKLILSAFEVSPCSGSVHDSLTVFILPVGIDDVSANDFALRVFPNPTRNIITVQANLPSHDPLILQVLKNNGQEIFSGSYTPIGNQFELHFDMSYLEPGIYFVRLKTKNEITTTKIIKLM